MEYLVICSVAVIACALTLFSGFGLGTLLMPAFAIFFPVDLAVALTAIVHFLNNLLKLFLLGRFADPRIVLKFGLPAVIAAIIGAKVLFNLEHLDPIMTYRAWGKEWVITPIKLVMGMIIFIFAVFELNPRFTHLAIDPKFLPIGGVLSGFFGGISGHQGALRAAFLIRSGLTKEAFIATGVVIACLVDITRLTVYSRHLLVQGVQENLYLLSAAVISAFAGTLLGSRLVQKVTFRNIQIIVGVMLLLIAGLLGLGIV